MWESFKRDYGKRYETMEEELSRFSNFLVNLQIADKRNQEDTALYGITKFMDLSQQEFQDKYLKSDPSQRSGKIPVLDVTSPPQANLGLVDWEGDFFSSFFKRNI